MGDVCVKWKKKKWNLITIPFLSGMCYGPIHVGVYDPWTFVGQICLIHRLLLFQPPPLARLHLVPSPLGSVPWVVGLLSFSCRCCLLSIALLFSGVEWGCFWRPLRYVLAILVHGRELPWWLIELVVVGSCMLGCLVGFLGRIRAELARLKFACGSCLFCLLRWGYSGPGV